MYHCHYFDVSCGATGLNVLLLAGICFLHGSREVALRQLLQAPADSSIPQGASFGKLAEVSPRLLWHTRRLSGMGGRKPLSTARLLRGAPVARRIREDVQVAAASLLSEFGVQPAVATLLVGNAGPSAAYHDAISKAMGKCHIGHVDVTLPVSASTHRVVDELQRLNEDPAIHGILVLLPLPHHIDGLAVISAVAPSKDVDGISPQSVGRLHLGLPVLHPSTPQAGLEILDYYQIPIAGKRATVIGRGNVVGKPMAALLTARDATVTLCHSRSVPLADATREAEIVVLAAGFPNLLYGDMIKPGATVIDFGVNVAAGKVFGDANAASVIDMAGAYTPVPGGTTPVTTMVLARNTVTAAYALASQES